MQELTVAAVENRLIDESEKIVFWPKSDILVMFIRPEVLYVPL